VIGGYAVIHYSQPRYTKDLDVWVEPTPENADKLMRVFARFGISTFGLTKSDFEVEGTQLSIGVAPVCIDFLTSLADFDFSTCWEKREIDKSGGYSTLFLSKEDLIAAKENAGRPQDLADIDELRRAEN
jgi:hypothetical protein